MFGFLTNETRVRMHENTSTSLLTSNNTILFRHQSRKTISISLSTLRQPVSQLKQQKLKGSTHFHFSTYLVKIDRCLQRRLHNKYL